MNLDLEIFRNLFVSIAEEMGIVLRRSSFSPNIKERRDYSCAVYDAKAETIAMGDHMPVHLGAMPSAVEEALRSHTLGPGDLVILNDPFRGGTHLPDITSVSAVFAEGDSRPAYYLATRAHHADVGGMAPGSMPLAREIYQEGLRIPPVKLIVRGALQPDLVEVILANVRTPDERRGDLNAQLASHKIGERRILEATRKWGREKLIRQMNGLKDYTERCMRIRLGEIGDGEWTFADVLDDDGTGIRDIAIRCRIRIQDSHATVDFGGSAPQARGGVNANRAVTLSAVMYCFRCLLEDSIPYNAGLMRPITVVTEAGTVVDAKLPASVAAGNVETSQRIVDTVFGALQQAAPHRIPAASAGTMNNLTLGGMDPRTGQPFTYYETIAGGMGARPGADGISAVHTHMTNSLNTPCEALEHFYPLRMKRYALRRNSGGIGTWHGGDGVIREVTLLTSATVSLLSDRRAHGPWGLNGGHPGASGRNLINEREVPAKITLEAEAGDTLRIETPGGGGYGSPHGK